MTNYRNALTDYCNADQADGRIVTPSGDRGFAISLPGPNGEAGLIFVADVELARKIEGAMRDAFDLGVKYAIEKNLARQWKPIADCPKEPGTVYLITDGIALAHAEFDYPASRGSTSEPYWDISAGTPFAQMRGAYDRWCDYEGVKTFEPTHWSAAIEPPQNPPQEQSR